MQTKKSVISIPYSSHIERLKIIKTETRKGNVLKNTDVVNRKLNFLSKAPNNYKSGGAEREYKIFKCQECFNTTYIKSYRDIQFIVCSSCGSLNVSQLNELEENRLIKEESK